MEFGDGFLLLVNEHEGVGFEDGQVVKEFALLLDGAEQKGLDVGVEVFGLIAQPTFHDAARQFLVLVVEYEQFAALLLHL